MLFLVFTVLPSVATFALAWWEWDPLGGQRWVGADNFVRLAGDPRFWTATTSTLIIAALATAAQVVVGLVLAHALQVVRGRFAGVLRISFLVPYVTSGAVVAILAAQLVDRDYGLLATVAAGWGAEGDGLLSDPFGARIVVAAMVAWRWFGFTTLLMFAVLDAVPRDIFRAAEMDGAGGWATFRFVSLPILGPVIAFCCLTSVVGALQLFTEPLLVDPGRITCGPARQCQTLALLVYETGFRDFQFGYAAAVASAVFVLAAGVVGGGLALSRRWGWVA